MAIETGVPCLLKRPRMRGAAPSSAAMASTRQEPRIHTEPELIRVRMMTMAKT